MAYDPSNPSSQAGYSSGRSIDLGLQSYMQSVYHTMGLGLVITGLTAAGIYNIDALHDFIFGKPLVWMIVAVAPLLFIWLGFTASRIRRLSPEQLRLTFVLFSATMGLSLSTIFDIYTGASIARVFFITAAMFAGTSLYGYTTKRDLTGVGSFMMMGLMGIIFASLINLFMHSAMVQFMTSVLGVVIFTGLAAWDTQNLKRLYVEGATEANAKVVVVGALNMYLNFINLFQMLLSLMGSRRN